jgi:vacuolar-type H+-ATPase subunit I/STV1
MVFLAIVIGYILLTLGFMFGLNFYFNEAEKSRYERTRRRRYK